MNASICTFSNALDIKIKANGKKEFTTYLSSLGNYDDGQGRSYDILDEELES